MLIFLLLKPKANPSCPDFNLEGVNSLRNSNSDPTLGIKLLHKT